MTLNEDNITNNRILRKRKWKTYTEAAQSGSFEDESVRITFNFVKSVSGKKFVESGKKLVDLEAIKKNLLNAKVSNTSPDICVDKSFSHNTSTFAFATAETKPLSTLYSLHDISETLEELEHNAKASFTGFQKTCNTED